MVLARGLQIQREVRLGWAQVGDRLEERFILINQGRLPALWVEVIGQTNVTVPAGEFADCWLIEQSGVQYFYAPYVGVVKIHYDIHTERILELESCNIEYQVY